MMLNIQNLHAALQDGTEILKGIHLAVNAGEVHAIMGPNGAGKSSLAKVVAGHPDYLVSQGAVEFLGQDVLKLAVHERAHAGLFIGFQYPVEVAGVGNIEFLRAALDAQCEALHLPRVSEHDFGERLARCMDILEMDERYKDRALNEGFSGGEKKRNEILQLLMLEPKLAFLDETDSGLDIDALRIVSRGINHFMETPGRAVVLVTHYQRLLDHVKPQFIHVLAEGKIVRSGGPGLALELEERGYEELEREALP